MRGAVLLNAAVKRIEVVSVVCEFGHAAKQV
jgi:hypothetical protein